MRSQLGIADDTVAVLYAPTYRDDEVIGEDVPLGLDLPRLVDDLGDGYVTLLRLHYYLGHRRRVPDSDRVRDLSNYPDVSDLLLAADVLVTDYSSVLFDFAVTGKPIVHYAYDLEHYRDTLRGFTFDLDAEAPGPITRTQPELTSALQNLDRVEVAYADRYARFHERFCHLEDGRATARIISRVFPELVPDRVEVASPA